MSTKKFIAKTVGGFVFVSIVILGIGVMISFAFDIDPILTGRYIGLTIFVVGLIWVSTLITGLVSLYRKARQREGEA